MNLSQENCYGYNLNYIRNSFLATGSLYDVEVMEELYHDLSQGTV